MDEDAVIDFLNILADEGLDLDDVGLDEDDLDDLDVDDLNEILANLDEYTDEEEDEED